MNLWSENEELQKDRRLEIAKGRRLRARLLDIRTKRQTIQAEIEHERCLYQAEQNSTKVSLFASQRFSNGHVLLSNLVV
jgi:hypothetical protein